MNAEEYAIMYRVEDRHWWYRGLRALAGALWEKHVVEARPRVLDAGCGTGRNLAWLEKRARPFGIDLSPEAIAFCRQRELPRLTAGSVVDLPFADSSFDVAFSFDVFCHKSIIDKQVPFREVARVLRPGGLFFLNLPAYQWLRSSHDVAVYTDHRFTKPEVLSLLRASALEPIETTYWNTLLFPPILLTRLWRKIAPPDASDLETGSGMIAQRIFGSILAAERRLIRHIPLPFGLSIFVVARRL